MGGVGADCEGSQDMQSLRTIPRHEPASFMISSMPWKIDKRNGARIRDRDGFRLRAAGICVRLADTGHDVLLVSGGKDGERWVVPGGGIEGEESPEEAARREVEEEAGVRAQTITHLGLFQDDYNRHRTRVFTMAVVEELESWEEGERGRQRRWLSLDEALSWVKVAHRMFLVALRDSLTNAVHSTTTPSPTSARSGPR